MSDPIVEIAQGKLKGEVRKTPKGVEFYSFKGIPYAKPPLGELRFSVPVAPVPWNGVRDATKDCNACPQYKTDSDTYIGNEDCLFLNVYTPELPATGSTPIPVMVFIHGGSFVSGNGTDDGSLGPEYLIEKGVILVSLNYRLGILGFLSLNCKDAPGNMGLRDQLQALKWVKQNILKFNGDPENVTIFGISAGGASVELLMLSRMARGYFHKAVAHSGSSLCPWAQYNKIKELAYKTAVLNGKEVLNDEELLQYLKGLDIEDLIMASMKAVAITGIRGAGHFGFVPVTETPNDWEPFSDKHSYALLKSGEFAKVPFMAGFSTRESLYVLKKRPHIFENVVTNKNFVQFVSFNVGTEEDKIEEMLKAIYLKSENICDEADAFGLDFITDVHILGGVFTAASHIVKHNKKPVYFYEFNYDGKLNLLKKVLNINRKGACHCDDVGYLFKSRMLTDTPTLNDSLVRERMVTMWTNFAKYGNPTPQTDNLLPVKWKPANTSEMCCLVINEQLRVKTEVYPNRVKWFQDLYEKYPPYNLS